MKGEPLSRDVLYEWYVKKQRSAAQVARQLGCSTNKVHYWLARRGIPARSRSDATYVLHNPDGDPFTFKKPTCPEDWFLFGLGIGLYWGEGNKKNTTAVRLGNTDPKLVRTFLDFLIRIYAVKKEKIRFGLQVFSDMEPARVLQFWSRELGYPKSHFGAVVVTPARSLGTYRTKSTYGVLTVYVSNKKLRDLLNREIERL